MPISIIKESTTVTSPQTENQSKNINAFTIKAAIIRPNIAKKIVEIIIPDVHAQLSFLSVAYANTTNNEENTNQTIVETK
jgi:hypothetical protein